jgi:3-hydroxy-9,10-secoandrosta-1,3,5(10)-triene-9,17-dione monooxygenase
MSNHDSGTENIAIPEPGLTREKIVARAADMKEVLRATQDESERRGHCSREVHEEFLQNGFYRILQPRRFGGYEFDLTTFWKVVMNVAAGDPGIGWYLALASHHALVLGSAFSERAQLELFGPDGDFRASHRPASMGTATPVEGGYVINGTWDYCSGIPYATHLLANTALCREGGGESPVVLVAVIPMAQATLLDDWGDGSLLGMQSSGSNSVRVTNLFIPQHWTANWSTMRKPGPTPGTGLHGNPMYLGMLRSLYHGGIVCAVVGAARASLDELEEILTTKKTHLPPQVPRYTHRDHQRAFGLVAALSNSAEALVCHVGELYMEYCERWARTGQEFSTEDDVILYAMLQQAAQLAMRAVEESFGAASTSAAKRGQRLQRYYRDMSVYRGHISAQYLNTATEYAKLHFGIPATIP